VSTHAHAHTHGVTPPHNNYCTERAPGPCDRVVTRVLASPKIHRVACKNRRRENKPAVVIFRSPNIYYYRRRMIYNGRGDARVGFRTRDKTVNVQRDPAYGGGERRGDRDVRRSVLRPLSPGFARKWT